MGHEPNLTPIFLRPITCMDHAQNWYPIMHSCIPFSVSDIFSENKIRFQTYAFLGQRPQIIR